MFYINNFRLKSSGRVDVSQYPCAENPPISAARRLPLRLAVATLALMLANLTGASHPPFGYEMVVSRAKALADKSFRAPDRVPESLTRLSYDEFRDIRFLPEKALWRGPGMNFDVLLIHAGLYYTHPVVINVHDADGVHQIPYDPDYFEYGSNTLDEKDLRKSGYAGFVLNYPLKRADLQSQVIVFAGASYFRAIGREHVYGLSARGLAIDTALPSGEEFPFFREFWLERPAPDARSMTVYALLDSPRVSGAYRFLVHPGETTQVHVKATLFLREPVDELGIAPLTSMFQYGEGSRRPHGYWRPEIHDSDGLLMENGDGEWIWRTLANEKRLRVSSFYLDNPRGFGLLQRDTDFDHYQDLEARYELRPGAWVVPQGNWGSGRVKLTEIPTDTEINDNVVAYWVSGETPKPGEPVEVEYRIEWLTGDPNAHGRGFVVGTRVGAGRGHRVRKFVVDFNGATLSTLAADAPVTGRVTVGEGGELKEQQIVKNSVTGGWRLVFEVKPPKEKPLELRAYLAHGESTLTETWSYLLE